VKGTTYFKVIFQLPFLITVDKRSYSTLVYEREDKCALMNAMQKINYMLEDNLIDEPQRDLCFKSMLSQIQASEHWMKILNPSIEEVSPAEEEIYFG